MKKIITLLMCAALVTASALTFTSCDAITGLLGDDHEHTFSEDWASDETAHWHAATCEHTEEVSDKADHTFEDGLCSVCGFEDPDYIPPVSHEHTFATEWSVNETAHWYAATCEHTAEVSNYAAHSFTDGVCVCGYEAPHEHTFATEWSNNATAHWHAATCEHTDEMADYAEHSYTDGVCVCGYEAPHEHTFATEWSSNDENHWHAATCEHTTEMKDLGAHDYADGVCSVCGKEEPADDTHEHSYATEWSKNETAHWHAATCDHTTEMADYAEHVFVDGVCECGYEKPHEHSYATEWSKNETAHWHAANCEHTDEKSDYAEHSFNENGVCECGYEKPHEHTYSDTWTYNETAHWHAADCEHTGEVSDYAEHVYTDGVCECGKEESIVPDLPIHPFG